MTRATRSPRRSIWAGSLLKSAPAKSEKNPSSPPTFCAISRAPLRPVPRYLTASEEETIALGERLARELPSRQVVLLIGDLGAAAPEEVSSPTFTLIHEYGRVYHIDLYRLDNARELATLGLDELFERDAVVLIEWGEKFPEILPEERTEIRIVAMEGDAREIEVRKVKSQKPKVKSQK